MKALWVIAAVGLSVMGPLNPASAQRGGDDYGYRERGSDRGSGSRDRDYGERDRGSSDRDRGGRDREREYGGRDGGGRDRARQAGFDEREYLRCHPDVRRAVDKGTMPSGAVHYKTFGLREGRRLSC